ncbi:FAD-linked oxidase [Cellulomonas chitinilytica]|uniref:FAD-linked oxidase n=1 Tax=Cellulomonas chitinilytica TaxID=398759 RepID=A0A919P4G7_9CELL|nr:FAD-dependent oxidoreductase [Cellulomonas chitinilytica]GIG21992.1 FAD-linked oxidase [Cellulomonas chitinilytica]
MPHALQQHVTGPVLTPSDDGYDDEVASFSTTLGHHPDVVVGATSVQDVVAAVHHARAHGLHVAAHATGHGGPPARSGVLVSTRRLGGVEVDAATRVATVGAGARWGDVVAAAAPSGLAPVAGSAPTVGVVGFLLGGGLGPFARSHGFSSDHLVSVTVVTGAGEVVEASEEHHPDLFWALRGGKWGLGIVTGLRVRLAEVPELYAGSLFFDKEHVEAALRGWIAWTATADPATTTSAVVVRFPPLDAVPPPLRGRTALGLRVTRPGDAATGERVAAPLRALAPVLLDGLGPLPLGQVARIHANPTEPGPSWAGGGLLSHADDDLASVWLDRVGPDADHPFVAVELRHVAGATEVDVPGGSAVSGRGAGFTFSLVALDPSTFDDLPAVGRSLVDDLSPWVADELNPNFGGGLGPPRWSAATSARLDEVRRTYDPDGVL